MPIRACGRFLVLLVVITSLAHAAVVPQIQPPYVGWVLPSPTYVPGKEYSDRLDINAAGAADPEQVLHWKGDGTVTDSFDYDDTSWPFGNGQVDALANIDDAYFDDVVGNMCPLLFSTGQWLPAVIGDPNVRYESTAGAAGIWATQAQINSTGGAAPVMNDVDALEIWGPGETDDANMFSLESDLGGTSIWAYDPATGVKSAYASQAAIAAIINTVAPGSILEPQIDLDGLMVYDRDGVVEFNPLLDSIMFSIAPSAGYDGGEIWVSDPGLGAGYLNHGGHLWNTAFAVQTTFGTPSENINALEAAGVPEPSSALILLVAVPWVRRRRARA